MSVVRVGTSGFAYPAWRPRFYPDGLAQSKLLAHYATRLDAVEINYTFNRFPTEQLLAGWASKVPEAFSFCLKMPRAITHAKRLRDCAAEIERFAAPARTLGERLGPALVQTPPGLRRDDALLEAFLTAVPPGLRVALELRDPTWNAPEPRVIAASAGAAWVIADTEGAAAPDEPAEGVSFAYLRLRAPGYDDAAVDAWAERVRALDAAGLDVFCFFRHDEDGANALAAERLASTTRRTMR